MEIVINGKIAVLKRNTSFDFVSENFLFTGSDSYTLSITFPLKDCPQNVAIFGLVSRKDVDKNNIIFDCVIRDKGFAKAGAITITEITDVEVKTQFLEGRSVQNFDSSFDDIYLNELRLGYPANRSPQQVTPANSWKAYPLCYALALPWVNNTSGNLQNEAKKESGTWVWKTSAQLSFQPYLLYLLERVCTVIGYTFDFNEIDDSEFRYLVICNTLPSAWEAWDFAYALPHWTLTEFFEELENFLFGEFVIDHARRHIDFHFTKAVIEESQAVALDKVVNAYTVNAGDKDCEYVGLKNIKYADNDNRLWPYRSCEWFVEEKKSGAVEYQTLDALLQYARTLKESGVYVNEGGHSGGLYTRGYKKGSPGHNLFYARDVDEYFIMYCYYATQVKTTTGHDGEEYHWYKYFNRLELINQFGVLMHDKEAEELEMNIVPAWIDETDDEHGDCLFLECGEMGSIASMEEEDDGNGGTSSNVATPSGTFGGAGMTGPSGRTNSGMGERTGSVVVDETDYNDGALAQPETGKTIERGEEDKSDEYFDRLYVGYWDGINRNGDLLPRPFTHFIETKNNFTKQTYPYSLSLRRATNYYDRGATIRIDGKKKYNFSWIADSIPDVRAVFNIWGKEYLCEKITAQFTEKGMSQMLKGVFYRIVES